MGQVNEANQFERLVLRFRCFWYGHQQHEQDYSPIEEATCLHCGEYVPYRDMVGDTRHNRAKNFLRRYASARENMLEQLKEGAEYMRGFRLERANRGDDQRGCGDGAWHSAINAEGDRLSAAKQSWPRMMYTAKTISDEVPRMVLLFQHERSMPDSYKMCAHDPRPATPLKDNHLRCALGQECRKCPYLAAIDRSEHMTPEAKYEAKAWTCATHFLLESEPDVYCEQILFDKGDDAFLERLMQS